MRRNGSAIASPPSSPIAACRRPSASAIRTRPAGTELESRSASVWSAPASARGDGIVSPSVTRELDEASRRALLALRFADDGGAALEPDAPGVSGALGRLLAIVHDAIAQGTWARLTACREADCEWAFYDHTKNRSGAWCSMEGCGNRAKARAYRERHARSSTH